jgi:hypothetical protein
MRRMIRTDLTREECLALAQKHEGLSQNAWDAVRQAREWDHARYFRSVALIANL